MRDVKDSPALLMNVCGLPALKRCPGNRPDGAETGEGEPPTGERETEAISEHICTDLKFSPARPNLVIVIKEGRY